MKHTLPGQLDMPEMPEQSPAQRMANAPLLPMKEQKPCDIGLFSDDANQIDLIEMLIDPIDD